MDSEDKKLGKDIWGILHNVSGKNAGKLLEQLIYVRLETATLKNQQFCQKDRTVDIYFLLIYIIIYLRLTNRTLGT